METEELLELTPSDLYSIQRKRRQENEKESSRVKEYFYLLLKQNLAEEIAKEKVVVCETRLSVSRLLKGERIYQALIDLSSALNINPVVRIIFFKEMIVEVEMMMGNKGALETRILPKDVDEFQKLKTYLSDWESRSKYFPRIEKPQMTLFQIEECTGKTIKEICDITVSKIKGILSGDLRM